MFFSEARLHVQGVVTIRTIDKCEVIQRAPCYNMGWCVFVDNVVASHDRIGKI